MALKAVLFDLDNTLLLYNENDFYRQYMGGLYSNFSQLFSLEEFGRRMLASTETMVANDGSRTNIDLFLDAFCQGLEHTHKDIMGRFNNYYDNGFDDFRQLMIPVAGVRSLFEFLAAQGLKTVIATNPMFPMEVQLKKLAWVGLDGFTPDLITSVENSSACKPNPLYYTLISRDIDVAPQECLMAGNDPLNDMIASRIGMKTYLTSDGRDMDIDLSRSLAKNALPGLPVPDFTGPLAGIRETVEKLMEMEG